MDRLSSGALQTGAVKGYGIAQRIERLPLTSYQNTIFLIIATAWFFDSMDLGMMTFILGSIKADLGLSTAQTGLLGSASFVGMLLGAATSGMLADRFGRRVVFQWSMVLWGLGSFLCAAAGNLEQLLLFRVLLGVGMGMEFPIGQSMVSEFLPAKQRGRYVALLEGFWPIGFIAAGLLAYVLLPIGGWRMVFEAAGNEAAFRASMELVRPGGQVVWLGKVPVARDVAFRWGSLMQEKRIIRSSYGGTDPWRDFPMLARAYQEGRLLLDEYITSRISLDQVNTALDRLKRGLEIRSVVEF